VKIVSRLRDIVKKQEDPLWKSRLEKEKLKTEVILPQTLIHSVLEGLQLSVERGVQMLFSDRNGSNPRPCCNNGKLILGLQYLLTSLFIII
jgi:hypothetical protein